MDSKSFLRIWLLPFSILLAGAAVVFLVAFALDASRTADPGSIWALLGDPDPLAAANTLANAAEVVAAVLAIAITVVAIVVELAANRYTHRITELFVSAPTNFIVTGFFVISALVALGVSYTFDYDPAGVVVFMPHVGVVLAMVLLAACLLILLPYFAFVFAFLNPISILGSIRRHVLSVIVHKTHRWPVSRRHAEAVRGIEQIADVGLNAMEHKDKGVSMASVDALEQLVLQYQDLRPVLDAPWFHIEGSLGRNPDFVSMMPELLEAVGQRGIWLELKVFRQYQTLYNEALNRHRDINCLVAINTRRIAEHALSRGNKELVTLAVKFFNTYLRATINARDIRTAYNVLHQYRLLAENALVRDSDLALEIARHFKYYGWLGFHANLPFVLETVAHDLCTLLEVAHDRSPSAFEAFLAVFLDVDKESEGAVQESSLRGVRKAQVKLAAGLLQRGSIEYARRVFSDMEHERPERLASIRDELLAVESSEFWEMSDRGVNFDYMPPAQRAKLDEFFGWFGDRLPART